MTPSTVETRCDLRADARERLWHWGVQMDSQPDGPLILERGEGSHVWDIDGNRYIDAISGLGVVQVGHGRPEIVAAISEQASRLAYGSLANGHSNRPAIELARRLGSMVPVDSPRVFFGSGGAESVEAAIKVARQHFRLKGQPERRLVIGRHGSYHGVTYGALSATGVESMQRDFEPLVPGFRHVDHPDPAMWAGPPIECAHYAADSLEQVLRDVGPENVAAFIAEPISTAGSIKVPPDEYWPMISEVCRRHGVLLVVDEIFTGFGRTGEMFASELWDIRPDILAVAKGLTSGYAPISAAVVSGSVAEAFGGDEHSQFNHASTWSGHPVAAAAALANLDILDSERLPERGREAGSRLAVGLDAIVEEAEPATGRCGTGLMYGLRLDSGIPGFSAPEVVRSLRSKGLMTRCSSSHLFVYPPLVITDGEVDSILESMREVLVDGHGVRRSGVCQTTERNKK